MHGLAGGAGKVWLSDNGGLAWTEYTSPGFGINRAAVRMDYDTCFISGEDGLIYKTTDHGNNWTLDGDFNGYLLRDMTIYPNPSSGMVYIKTHDVPVEDFDISIFSIAGELIYKEHHSYDANIISFDASEMEAGLYLVAIINKARKYTSKLIIKH